MLCWAYFKWEGVSALAKTRPKQIKEARNTQQSDSVGLGGKRRALDVLTLSKTPKHVENNNRDGIGRYMYSPEGQQIEDKLFPPEMGPNGERQKDSGGDLGRAVRSPLSGCCRPKGGRRQVEVV
ncbi:hypothetical protein CDL15_Pgr026870 [Punica granatum]|uniref:Uncharacterized protein n=1 Tax=Punica granatum TaxID=22663 RepID=A0A218WM97_PUNGR|nr:hypothetical protein CDL15_Pgr026870 [Punica granatum]PKI64614.1 hypothetical protein CRG98_015046 [Punica granatum]